MYTSIDFTSKKSLKEAVKEGKQITVYQPGPFGTGTETGNKSVTLEGPHYPKAHTWYAQAVLKDGVIIKVT